MSLLQQVVEKIRAVKLDPQEDRELRVYFDLLTTRIEAYKSLPAMTPTEDLVVLLLNLEGDLLAGSDGTTGETMPEILSGLRPDAVRLYTHTALDFLTTQWLPPDISEELTARFSGFRSAEESGPASSN